MRAFEIQLHKAIRESVLRFDSSVVTILKQYKELAERLGCTEDIDYAKTELEGYSLESVMFREVGCYSNFFSPSINIGKHFFLPIYPTIPHIFYFPS